MIAPVSFTYRHRVVQVTADMPLVDLIERELGSLPALATLFRGDGWQVGELVMMVHLFLQHARVESDFYALGNDMLQGGFVPYLRMVRQFLQNFSIQDMTP